MLPASNLAGCCITIICPCLTAAPRMSVDKWRFALQLKESYKLMTVPYYQPSLQEQFEARGMCARDQGQSRHLWRGTAMERCVKGMISLEPRIFRCSGCWRRRGPVANPINLSDSMWTSEAACFSEGGAGGEDRGRGSVRQCRGARPSGRKLR